MIGHKKKYKHLFFDMDKTVAPAREPILEEMRDLLENTVEDVVIVSGQLLEKIDWQTKGLTAYYLGNNGNHANNTQNQDLWKNDDLSAAQKAAIHRHISSLIELLEIELNQDWNPIEDRGSQITFSPIGNTAPVELKRVFDPDRQIRERLLRQIPFESDELMVKIGGSTSFDYLHKERHKGVNVLKLIELQGWKKEEAVYYGDGLYPGGNDEVVIGVIDTVPVNDHLDTYEKLVNYLREK